jgi:hypothetical protein
MEITLDYDSDDQSNMDPTPITLDYDSDDDSDDDDDDDDDEVYSENHLPPLHTIVEVLFDDQWWIAKVIRHADTRIWVQYDCDGSKSDILYR